jgi:hypothetical protein
MSKTIFILFLALAGRLLADAPDTTKLPAAWKSESIVVMEYNHSFRVKKFGKHEEKLKVVYYLRDKWGLDEVSQISLPSKISGNAIGSSIGLVYKKNGTVVKIDTTHLIPRKTKIDFKNTTGKKSLFSIEADDGQKLAVPSLEVGDILEINYECYTTEVPTILTLTNKYCVADFSVSMNVDNSLAGTNSYYYGMYMSLSMDPKIMNSKTAFEIKEADRFTVHMRNLDKYKEEILNDNLTQIPYVLISFQYSGATKTDPEFVKMTPEEMKKDQDARVKRIYYDRDKEERRLAKRISAALKKRYPKIDDTLAYVNDAYYLYREIVGGEYLYAGYNRLGYKSNFFFVNVMSRVLWSKRITNKVFLSQESHYGGTAKEGDLLEPVYGLVIPKQNYYLFNPLYNLEPGNIPVHFENQTYVSFTASKYYKKNKWKWWLAPLGFIAPSWIPQKYDKNGHYGLNRQYAELAGFGVGFVASIVDLVAANAKSKKNRKYDYTKGQFPLSQPSYNQISTDLEIKNLKTEGKPLEIESKHSFYGKMKLMELSKLNNYSDIYNIEKNIYREMLDEKSAPQTIEQKEKEDKTMKKVFKYDLNEDGFEVDKVTSYSFDQANFFNTLAPLKYSINYTTKDILIESGDYLILNAGHLIGTQLIVGEKSSERTQDFYIPYQKQYTKQITINIPAGYTVQNIEDFTVSKETAAGKFVSKAYVDGNKVVINTTKVYGFQYYDREDVNDIYSFLSVAEQFRNKKLVLKK